MNTALRMAKILARGSARGLCVPKRGTSGPVAWVYQVAQEFDGVFVYWVNEAMRGGQRTPIEEFQQRFVVSNAQPEAVQCITDVDGDEGLHRWARATDKRCVCQQYKW